MKKDLKSIAINWFTKKSLEDQFYEVIPWLQRQGKNTTSIHPHSLSILDIEIIYREKKALDLYQKGIRYSVSKFIDDDTILAGYGDCDLEFEYPLPDSIIFEIFGTKSWREYTKNKLK